MSSSLEILLTSDTNNSLWTSCVWDPHTGSNLMTYKGGGAAETRTLTFIGNDYLASIERSKPIMHVWPLNSHQTVQGMRFILPGRANSLAITQDGMYIIAGIDEKIYLWQTASGELLTIINRHYQKVLQLQFTRDGNFFVSAAEDGMVMVWSLATVAVRSEVQLVTQSIAGQHDPVHIFSDHSLPVTDLYISKMGMHGRLYTVSSDRTCKIYDLATGEMLLNLVFDVPLSAVTMDVLELSIFLGTVEGKILQFSVTNIPRNRDLLINDESDTAMFISHTKAVTCLSTSLDGETLVSGSNDEQVILWHIRSRQPIRTIRHKGPITNTFFSINLPAIFKQEFTPNVILHNLERTLEKDSDEVTEIEVLNNKKINFWPKELKAVSNNEITLEKIQNKVQQEESVLLQELEKLKKINANLYAFSIQKTIDSAISDSKSNKKNKKRL